MVSAGVKAQNIVSHADIKSTGRYAHPRLAEIQAAVTKLGTIFPGYDTISVNPEKDKITLG